MAKLTRAIAKANDVNRKMFLGRRSTLFLLEHSSDTYSTIAQVKKGWDFSAGSEDELPTLSITESRQITEQMIIDSMTGAFAINGLVYKIEGTSFSSPLGEAFREWKFQVKPTGQQYPSS